MTQRAFLSAVGVAICMLLLVLVMEAAGMRRSLRRIEREERGLVSPKFTFAIRPVRLSRPRGGY